MFLLNTLAQYWKTLDVDYKREAEMLEKFSCIQQVWKATMASQSQHNLDPLTATANVSDSSHDGNIVPIYTFGKALVGNLDGTYSYVDKGSPPASQVGLEEGGQEMKKSTKARKKTSLSLTYGMIRFKWIAPKVTQPTQPTGSDEENNQEGGIGDADNVEVKKQKRLPVFDLVNRHMAKPIQLYGNQMLRLIEELPTAYEAFYSADDGYRFELVKAKDQLVTLEVSLYNNKTYLFLKKYFKPEDHPYGNQWVPTRSMLSFNPDSDDPDKLLDFYADCCQ